MLYLIRGTAVFLAAMAVVAFLAGCADYRASFAPEVAARECKDVVDPVTHQRCIQSRTRAWEEQVRNPQPRQQTPAERRTADGSAQNGLFVFAVNLLLAALR